MTRQPCRAKGCIRMAEQYPVLKFYAKSDPEHVCGSLDMCMPQPICAEHQRDFDAKGCLLPETKKAVRDMMAALHKAEPDLNNPVLIWGTIGDELWTIFEKGRDQ